MQDTIYLQPVVDASVPLDKFPTTIQHVRQVCTHIQREKAVSNDGDALEENYLTALP